MIICSVEVIRINFCHLILLQQRSELIKNAQSALEAGQINVNGFLNRVTCREARLIDDLLDFDNLADEDNDDDDDDDMASVASSEPSSHKSNLCGGCVEKERDTVLFPCTHVYYCWDCWQKWLHIDPMKFDLHQYLSLDDSDLLEETAQPTPACPICKVICTDWKQIRFA